MTIFLIPLTLIPLAIIIYLAFSKKTDPLVRKIALWALILIALSIGVCAFIIINWNSGSSSGPAIPIVQEETETKNGELRFAVLFAVFFIGLVVLLLILQSREKKAKKKLNSPVKSW